MMALKVSHWVNVMLIMIDLSYSIVDCDIVTYSFWHKFNAIPIKGVYFMRPDLASSR